MKNYDLITPEGTQDFLFDECVIRRNVENTIHSIFKKSGYSEIITPGLEFFDVFNLNSRHFPQENLYKLVDSKGRLMVLRPDSTMPVARVIATRLNDAPLPLRLYYNQCVYTLSPMLKGRSDQIVQTGIELVGSSSRTADLEVITTAIEVLSSCSGGKFSLEIGDSGFFKILVNKLDVSSDTKEDIRSLIEAKNYPALNDLLDKIGKNDITHALKKLPRLFGGEEVFEKASKLFSDEKTDKILENLKSVYNDVSAVCRDGSITVDLGMVNRTDYYTGIIIKGYLEGYGEEVLSGGRYDKLISEFGYDVPATGFAVNVDAVVSVIAKKADKVMKPSDVIVFAEKGYEMKAVMAAQDFRKDGLVAENALCDTLDDVKKYAAEKGIGRIFVVNENITEVAE